MSYPKINILGTADFGQSQIQNVALHVATGVVSPINGQIYLSSTDNIVYCYNSGSGTFFPLTNIFSMTRGGTSPTGQTYVVGSGSNLIYSNSGNIDANLFKHNSIIAVVDGGTASTGFDTYGLTYYDGTALVTSSVFGYDPSIKGLRIRSGGTPSGVLHIGAGTGPLAYVTPMDRLATAMKNTVEYNGTGWFFTDNFGISYRVATTGMSLTSFTGTLPIANGGTNATSFTNQGLIKYNGSALTSFLGTNIGEVAYWDGSQWTSSSGSFVSLVPDSASRNTIQSPTGSYYPLLIRGASGQTTYFRIENYQNTAFFRVTSTSLLSATDLLQMDTINTNAPNVNAYIWMESDAPSGYSNPYIELRPNGGVGGYIKITGGGNTSKSGGHLDLSGGAGTASPGGTIDLTGGAGVGAEGGSIDLSGAGTGARGGVFTLRGGGSNNASGGVWDGAGNSLPGGHVITRDGGGSINTNSGFIQLGQAGNRTTLFTMPTGTASFTFPRSTGYIATSTVPYATGYAYWNGTGVLIATGVSSVGGGGDVYLANKNIFTNQNIFNSSGITILSPNGSSSGILAKANGASNYTAILPDSQGDVYFVTQSAYGSSGFLAVALGSGSVSYISNKISSIGDASINTASSGQVLTWNSVAWVNANPSGGGASITTNQKMRSITASFAGYPISSGQYVFTRIPYAGTIQKYTILGRPSGSLQFDIRPTGYSAYPTNNSICASALPNISNNIKVESSVLTGWNTALASGDCIDFVVTSGNALMTSATLIIDILVT